MLHNIGADALFAIFMCCSLTILLSVTDHLPFLYKLFIEHL